MDPLENLRYEVTNANGDPIHPDARMQTFVRRYAVRWLKRYGSLPKGQHPFPNPWDYTFIVDFGSRVPAGDSPASDPS